MDIKSLFIGGMYVSMSRRLIAVVVFLFSMIFFSFNSVAQRDVRGMGSREAILLQIEKLKSLESRNIEKLKQYDENPSAQVKLKSNLVIIRLKLRTLSEQLTGGNGKVDTPAVELQQK